ncbi:hypothetical protein M5D96_001956, partial [Drosophila gunungcola]
QLYPDVLQSYEYVKQLRPLGKEFTQFYQNVTLERLGLFESEVSSPQDLLCLADLEALINGFSSNQSWAFRMIDSWGSIPSGVLTGNIWDLGYFDECLSINQVISSSQKISGKYCFLIANSLRIATCFPASCSSTQMELFDQNQIPAVVRAFSARANSRTLFRIEPSKSNPNVIECLHGIRCMSLIWVIFSHEYIFSLKSPNLNKLELYSWAVEPFASFVLHGYFSVDSFFVLGGLLVSMIVLRSMEKSGGRLNPLMMYLHRIIRILPVLAVAIIVYMTMMTVVSGGPLFKSGYHGKEACENGWFWTLLFIQNYAVLNICLDHTWYLAVDMQLYIIAPILLISLYKWGKKAAAGIAVLVVLLLGCLFATQMVNHYSLLIRNTAGDDGVPSQKLYLATHVHAAPWLIGFLFGYFLHLNRGKKFELNWLAVWSGWILSLAMLLTSIFALYPAAQWSAPPLSTLEDAEQPEDKSILQGFQGLKKLKPLGIEFAEYFQNVTLKDLSLSDSSLPTQEDLLCLSDMAQFMFALQSGQLWALKMIDSWGSIPSGLFTGNIYDLGNFDECINIKRDNIRGKYCFLEAYPSKILGSESAVSGFLKMKTATCFPASCSAKHMNKFLPLIVKVFSARANTRACFRIVPNKSRPNVIHCLNGIRGMSLFWCLDHTWYLAVDMQLFLISPILLFALYKWGKKAAAGIFVLIVLLSGCLFATMMVNHYSITSLDLSLQKQMYFYTHTHAAPWLIGFLYGYFLYLSKGKKFQLSWIAVWSGWILCMAMLFTSIFALQSALQTFVPQLSLYYTLTRVGWPLAIGWVVFACMQGYGGLANSFLSSPLWQPISKLSYSAYIWHSFIQQINQRITRTNTYFSDYQVMLQFWSTLGLTLLFSYLLFLLIEAPIGGLDMLLRPQKKAPAEMKTTTESDQAKKNQIDDDDSTIFLCGLALVSADKFTEGAVRPEFQRVEQLRSLGLAFAGHFQDVELNETSLLDTRVPTEKDLLCLSDLTAVMMGLQSGQHWALKMSPSKMLDVDSGIGNFKTATCFPASCSAAHMNRFMGQLVKQFLNVNIPSAAMSISDSSCQTSEREPWDGLTIFMITQGKLNVPMMYLHRLIRIVPLLAIAIVVYMKFMPMVTDGPLFEDGYSQKSECERSWYLTLLFVNNYTEDSWSAPALSTVAESSYYTLTTVGWSMALCWVIFACMHGYGGLANSFLSSPLWQPLSRLSYSVYIWHMFFQEVNMLNFWSTFGFTVLFAYVMYLLVEAPFGGLDLLLGHKRKSPPLVKQKSQIDVNGPSNMEEHKVTTPAPAAE